MPKASPLHEDPGRQGPGQLSRPSPTVPRGMDSLSPSGKCPTVPTVLRVRGSVDESASRADRRRLAGARAQGSGAAFERWLSAYIFRPLVERGDVAIVDRLTPPARPVYDAAKGRLVLLPTAPGGVDWALCLKGGYYCAVEAKSTLDLKLYRSEIEPHQITHLDAAAKAGAGSFLAVQFRDGPTSTAYLIPWRAAPWAKARSAESISAADLGPWVIRGWIDAARLLGEL